jgi:cysteinyl-tRNA synthetase
MRHTPQASIRVLSLIICMIVIGSCAGGISDTEDGVSAATGMPTALAKVTIPVEPGASAGAGSVGEEPGAVDKWALWEDGTKLRGANIYQRRVYPELDGTEFMGPDPVGPPFAQQDFDRLAQMGANYVNISHPGLFTETPPYVLDDVIQANLDNLLAMIAQADMFAVISFRTGPGRAEFSVCCLGDDWFPESYLNDRVWEDQAAQDAWVEMWRFTAGRYRDNPVVVGYDLMVEPNANEVLTGEWLDPEDFYAQYGDTLADWNQLYPRLTAAIRQVDGDTPILVGGNGYSGVEWLPYLEPTGDPRTVYLVHQYAPHLYTHQWGDSPECVYPGNCDLDWDGQFDDWLDRAWLDDLLFTVDDFASTHAVPVAANEFGVVRWVAGAAEFMDDQMDLLEERDLNHALWVWDPAWPAWNEEVNAFNFRHGPDPENHSDVAQSELMDAIADHWGRNTIRPFSTLSTTAYIPLVTTPAAEAEAMSLDQVRFWAYQLQDLSEPGAVDVLVESHYDLLVLEPTRTDWSSDDRLFDTKDMVARLKASSASDDLRRKMILAYIDIGEAEDWRWYWTWSTDWDCRGEPPSDWPSYILVCDPDGWGGNYPAAYWDPAWKDIVIYGEFTSSHPDRDYHSAIDEAIGDGFDGVYLDWVEGYEDEAVMAAAQAAGVDPAAEMIAFIGEMRDYAVTRAPEFLIVQQNAAELLDGRPELLDEIDAIAQEAIWYDGDATDDWQDPDGYDWPHDPGLTSYYLEYLGPYMDAGLPVFNCEYALDFADGAYNNAYGHGFVPYVTRRSLSRLTTTPPPGY